MADWAGLHDDILFSILEKVRHIEDFFSFGSVCKSWREAASNSKHSLGPQIPWLMLVDRKQCRPIYNFNKDNKPRKDLHFPGMSGKDCIGLNYGWVLTVSRNKEINLVHPLSRSRKSLPNGQKLRISYMENTCAALSANPSQISNFVLMIVHNGTALYLRYRGLGDQQWTPIQKRMPKISDLTYYQDRFYGIDYYSGVWSFNVCDPRECFLVADLSSFYPYTRHIYPEKYIVASEGSLLVVTGKAERGFSSEIDFDFRVYEMDLINGQHKQIKRLRDGCSIFLGQITSISADVSESRRGWIKPNRIYLADIEGCYSLEDEQFTKFKARRGRTSFEREFDSTFWFIPSF